MVHLASSLRANAAFFAVLAIYVGFCLIVFSAFDFPLSFRIYDGFFIVTAPTLGFIVLVGASAISLLRHRPRRPFAFLRGRLINEWQVPMRLAWALPVILAYHIFMSAFTSLKIGAPAIIPFYIDPWLARLDVFVSPLPLLAPVLHSPFAVKTIDWIYVLWFPVNYTILLIAAFSLADFRLRAQYQVAFLLTWFLLGNLAAGLLASVGPCFYSAFFSTDPYSAQMATLAGITPLFATQEQTHLLEEYKAASLSVGNGISACPSLHVAIALLGAIYIHARSRRFGYLLFAYTGLIFLGSIVLGWHYAIDGYVSLLVVPLIWALAGKLVAGRTGKTTGSAGRLAPGQAGNARSI